MHPSRRLHRLALVREHCSSYNIMKSLPLRRSVYTLCPRCSSSPDRAPFSLSPSSFTRKFAFPFPPTRRHITNSRAVARNGEDSLGDSDPSQAHPLSGYYADILNTDSPYKKWPVKPGPVSQSPEGTASTSTSEPQSREERMSIVFGTRLASPGYRSTRYNPATTSPEATWKTINGVAIPPRPDEPDNCCMSGCVHCVWDDYRSEMEEWAGRVKNAQAKGASKSRTGDMLHTPRPEVDSASISMDDDGGGSETNWSLPDQGDDLFAGIPVGIREFMKTEKRLRQKHEAAA